jgi:hypothetical protein
MRMVFQEHARKDQFKKQKQEETMKKLWIVLLSVALIAAFAMPVCAADVKFSGSYVIQGYYENNRALVDNGASLMNTWQRLRMQTDIKVQEGLSLTVGADVMDKIWGASRSGTATPGNYANVYNLPNNAEDENIHFTMAYVSANLWGGLLRVGYQRQGQFGTTFGDYGDYTYGPRIRYDYVIGPWTLLALYDKTEATQYYSSTGPAGNIGVSSYQVDNQQDAYVLAFMYDWGKGNAGLLYKHLVDARNDGVVAPGATDTGYRRLWEIFDPYVKAQIGPVYLEAEGFYLTGKTKKYDVSGNGTDMTKDGLSAYISATVDFAPAYAGITLVYVEGNDPTYTTSDKDNSGWPGMTDFNPCLILWNFDLQRWNGGIGPVTGAVNNMNGGISNAQFAQIFAGVKPIPKLDVKASYSTATADKDGVVGQISKNYGSEFDVMATYKIFDNLTYMVGFGYLWAGDYWKGSVASNNIDNDYLVTQKLTLTF